MIVEVEHRNQLPRVARPSRRVMVVLILITLSTLLTSRHDSLATDPIRDSWCRGHTSWIEAYMTADGVTGNAAWNRNCDLLYATSR